MRHMFMQLYLRNISNPQDDVTPVQHHMQDLLIADDPIRAHVASIDSNLDGALLDSALSSRLKFSKLAMSIVSVTMSNEKCELFESEDSDNKSSSLDNLLSLHDVVLGMSINKQHITKL